MCLLQCQELMQAFNAEVKISICKSTVCSTRKSFIDLMRSDLPSYVIDVLLLWKEFILSFLPQLTGISRPCEARTHYSLH